MEVRLPLSKLEKLRGKLNSAKRNRKLTLLELQSLIGVLNFACAVVSPGRTFLRRLIDLTKGLQNPHHRRSLNKEARADIEAWCIFIEHFNGSSMFLEDRWETSETLELYTDSSGLGCGGFFGSRWFSAEWTEGWKKFDISVKELFPIVVAVELWGKDMANKRICFFSDNMAVVQVINKQTAKDPNIMRLLRRLIVQCLKLNILFRSRHVPGVLNILSDKLSRLQIADIHQLAPQLDQFPAEVTPEMFNI